MRHLPDVEIHDEIVEIRTYLDEIPASGDCLGRRMAVARLICLEGEMIRRYENELWGADK